MGERLRRLRRALLGERPAAILLFVTPTALAVAIDFALRARSLLVFPPLEWLNYVGSSLASAGFWGGPLWLASRLWPARSWAARAGLGLFGALFVLPLAVFALGGQVLYYRVFHYYMGRDTVRLGMKLRGTLWAWLESWGGSLSLMILIGLGATALFALATRRAADAVRPARPVLPIAGFVVAAVCFWTDFVESRSLQAAPPDTCFIHGVVHAVRDAATGQGWVRRGISQRQPAPLPALARPEHRPNVVLIVGESLRADALCSERTPACASRFLDATAGDRASLGRLTTQSSGTFSACVMLWTGLPPDADFAAMHRAPVLWEVARAEGYRTAYIGSQNLRYDDFAAFLERAGIDVLQSAIDLGGAADPHVGAPDENAAAHLVSFVKDASPGAPYFAVLHLSNTHWPYRVDPRLQPFAPHDESPLGPAAHLHNHYRNSVLMQERMLADLVRDLRALPGWDDTAIVFLSDHGEQFREHGGLYHLSSLFEEQVRVPGWILAGPRALDASQRGALAAWVDRRTYSQDVHATVLDLLGALDARPGMPMAERLTGRSLLRPPPPGEPAVVMSTASGVWEPDDAKYGAMQGDLLAVRSAGGGWQCFDAQADPGEHAPLGDLSRCQPLVDLAQRRFAASLK